MAAPNEKLLTAAEVEPACKDDPRAPHGFLRQSSHAAGRYVCECEHWQPPTDDQVEAADEHP
jgi:hypothetical protein